MRSKEEFGLIVMRIPHMIFDELDTLSTATKNLQNSSLQTIKSIVFVTEIGYTFLIET